MSETVTTTRVKRAYTHKAPLRSEEVRATPARDPEVRETKKRTRNAGTSDRLHIPREMIPDGVDLQWVATEILGQPAMQNRMKYERQAWEAVTAQMFGARFDGWFMPKGYTGEITVEGLVLMWRPLELTQEARAEERQAAHHAVHVQERQLRSGNIDGVNPDMLDPRAPNSFQRLTRTVEAPLSVPK